MTFRRAVASGLVAERSRRGLNQAALGSKVGLSRSAISDTENGLRAMTLEEALAVCRALDVPLRALLADADPADRDALGL